MTSLVVISVAFLLSLSSVESNSDASLLQELIRELKSVSADTVPDSDNLADPSKPAPASDTTDPIDIANPINGDSVEPVVPSNLQDLDDPMNLDNPAEQANPIDATDAIIGDKIDSDNPTDPNELGDPTNPGDPIEPINPTNSDGEADPPSDTTELGDPTDLDQPEPIYISSHGSHANDDTLDPIDSVESEKPSDLEKSAIKLARQVDKLTKLMFMKAEQMAKAEAALQDSPAVILSETENVALEQERYELLAARLSEMRDSLKDFFGTIYQQLSGFSDQFEEPNSKESSQPKDEPKAAKQLINLLKNTAADPKKRNNESSSSMLNRLLQAL